MKKLLALLLCMAMTLSLSACSGDFWYPLNLLFENKATVEQAETSEDAGDVEEEDAKETADKPDEREEDATEVEKEEQEKKKEESKKETSNKQVNNRERTGKYKVSYSNTEEDYHSFDIEHLDLVDDLEDDLEILKTKKDTKTAIIPVGYAHGFMTEKSNDTFRFRDKLRYILGDIKSRKYYAEINGKKAEILGRIGMFNIICDITDIDASPGDKVILQANPIFISDTITREYK